MTFYFLTDRRDILRVARGLCRRCCKPRGESRAKTLCDPCADRMRDERAELRINRALA